MNKLTRQLIVFLLTCLVMHACNPIKRVLKDPVKFKIVADSVVKRGYCVNDSVTTTISNVKLIYKDTTIFKKVFVSKDCILDTITPDGFHIRLNPLIGLEVAYTGKQTEKIITNNIHTSVRDKRLENILKDELDTCNNRLKTSQIENKDLKVTIKDLHGDLRTAEFKFWGFISLLVLVILVRLYIKFRTKLPF